METVQAIVKSWRQRTPVARRLTPRESHERRTTFAIVDAAVHVVARNTFFNDDDKSRIIKELLLLKD